MDDLMLRAVGLTRNFGATRAVDGLDLAVRRGELFGLVGPDGAGKTTTLRLLAGVLRPDAGQIWIDGLALADNQAAVQQRMGYVAQRFSLYGDLTVAENIDLTASLFGVPPAVARARQTDLLRLTGLTGTERRLAQYLSGGMKQKLALACALVHAPDLLVLDEPTNGVDPVARREFWRLLTGLRADGATVVVSTAYLDEAALCGRIGVMAAGRLLMTATVAELTATVDTPMVEVAGRPRQQALLVARVVPGVVDVRVRGDRLVVAFAPLTPPDAATAALTQALTAAGVAIESIQPASPTLEDAVATLMRRDLVIRS